MAGTPSLKATVSGFKKLRPTQKVGVIILMLAALSGSVGLFIWAKGTVYEVLFSNLDPLDAGSIVERLKSMKIPYKVEDNGRTIFVPKERVYELRLQMASQGLPSGGTVGFEVFDKTKLGITEFAQQVNYQRALQGELSRTITSLSAVESARVHIVLPKKSVFLEREEPASASVVLKLRSPLGMSEERIQGIVHLVASSVPGLRPENVTVVDAQGKVLSGAGKEEQRGILSVEQLEFQQRMERNLEEKVKGILAQVVGSDKATVKVSAEIDFRKGEKLEELYDPEKVAIRSEQSKQIYQGTRSKEAQTPVAVIPVEPKEGALGGQLPESQDSTKTVNYEVSKTVRKVLEPAGVLKRISVAVVVDGTYKVTKTKKGETVEYVPRSEKELEAIKELVKGAINYNKERGDLVEVVNLPFQGKTAEKIEGPGLMERLREFTPYLRYLMALVIFFLIYSMVIKPVLNWLTKTPGVDVEIVKQLPLTVKEIEASYSAKQAALAERVRALLSEERDTAEKVVKSWLGETAP